MQTPWWVWIVVIAGFTGLVLFDLLVVARRPHAVTMREATLWVTLHVSLAALFGCGVWYFSGSGIGEAFFAGYVTEYSLSVDNLFVFRLIMGRFAVPRRFQQEVLMVGIVLALVFRGVFILIGAQLIEHFSWIFYLFGLFLVYTAFSQAFTGHDDEKDSESRLIRFLRRRIAVTDEFEGARLRTTVGGRRVWTPALIVFIALGTTDLVFALDSIPAIFGITQDAFLVFAANVFALMGLRQLYFLLGDLVERLVYLKYGIAVVLAFIGVKLFLHALHENELPFLNGGHGVAWAPEIPTVVSLGVIVVAMGVAVVASLARMRSLRAERVERVE